MLTILLGGVLWGGGGGMEELEKSVLATSHRALEVDLKMPSQADTPVWQDVKDAYSVRPSLGPNKNAGPLGHFLSSSHKLAPCLSHPLRLTHEVPI